jgi:glycosyltransferase involved in cell wall biosynthesis
MNLRVLHIVPSFTGGGAEHQLVQQSLGLVSRGADVHIAYLRGGPNLRAVQQSGITLHPLPVLGNYDPSVIASLFRIFYKIKPTVVQTWLLHADVFGGIAARLFGIPWILSERSSGLMYENGYKFALRRHLGLRADAVVANSEVGLNYWRSAGYKGLGFIVRNIIRGSVINLNETVGGDTGRPMIIAVGRFSSEKNWPKLLTALESVMQRAPEVRGALVGDGPLRGMIESDIAESSVLKGRIDLPGHVDDVAERLHRATVFVSLSSFEGSPNAVLEATVAGCPLVLSDIPAHRELLSEDEACFVSLSDEGNIADAIIDVLKNTSYHRQRTNHARSRLIEFSEDNVIEACIDIYRRVAEKRSKCASL